MTAPPTTELRDAIAHHWGIHDLRPLQEPAMQAVLSGRDSLVVMPTGGGKSLCYQAPALLREGLTVVVSPLIALMKDQVDGLISCGINAVQYDSSKSLQDRLAHEKEIRQGKVRLLFVSPERLAQPGFISLLESVTVNAFAIDEAHCVSHWGHDFRPEYRQLKGLQYHFPKASFHAYTATATEQVRQDIIEQLGLRNPEILIGDFDRPNLTYRVLPRFGSVTEQALSVINRHQQEGGIIYCLRRADVDSLCQSLKEEGIKALPYHAGMDGADRAKTQEAFTEEHCDVVVATVAFGMGIDRSNVRYVLHTAMPKSLEHYQQEAGRAGRDGLPAECVLFHSGSDFFSWKSMIEKSASEHSRDSDHLQNAIKHLNSMDNYCRIANCRHGMLVKYFGQDFEKKNCNSCDVCLGETVAVKNATEIAQKILSCVARLNERFGVGYVISILRGENLKSIREKGHETLSTYGLLKGHSPDELRDWIYQLIFQDALAQEEKENLEGRTFSILRLTRTSWEVMRGNTSVNLSKSTVERKSSAKQKKEKGKLSSSGPDQQLFEVLRQLRRQLADERNVPPYIVFSDATLQELVRIKPKTLAQMRSIYGIGDNKLQQYGRLFMDAITNNS